MTSVLARLNRALTRHVHPNDQLLKYLDVFNWISLCLKSGRVFAGVHCTEYRWYVIYVCTELVVLEGAEKKIMDSRQKREWNHQKIS